MPEISRFLGMVVTMYYRDHPPPHFHVRYGGGKAIWSIDPPALLDGDLPPRLAGLLTEWAIRHRGELRENWARARGLERLQTIPPLE